MPKIAADTAEARREVLETALLMSRRGLSPGRSGNISRRTTDGMAITPSGMAYESIGVDDIVLIQPDGFVEPGQRKPSSEWRLHQAVYAARADVGAVVHTHSMHATVLACAGREIPAFHYMVAAAGGDTVPLVRYATFGSEKLSDHVAKGLKKHNACLIANHGLVAVGSNCASALELAGEVEVLAEHYWKVLAIGKPKLLSKKEMLQVSKLFKGYGQKAQSAGD